jgi:hypothetical protein
MTLFKLIKSLTLTKNINLFFIFLFISNVSFGQEEYFVQVNPATCSYTIIDSLPGVKWIAGGSAFDKINNRYIFEGADINYNDYLYSINATNGNILSNPSWVNYFSLMEFDNATGILYGIHWTTTLAAGADFVSINPTNLNYTNIHQINLTGLSGDVTFDDINHRFIFIANDSVGNNCLFCIDVVTGNVISKPLLSTNVSGIQFDNSTGNIYGLQWDNSLQTEYFDSINIANGNTTIISSIPLVNTNHKYSTFDEINKRYTFVWTDSSNNDYLYTVNATNGQVVSNPLFPVFISPYNLLEFRYDNSNGNLYALHWGPKTNDGIEEIASNKDIIIYPNPATETMTIEALQKAVIEIMNIEGQRIKTINDVGTKMTIDIGDLSNGVYIIKATTDKGVAVKKFIKE